MLVLSRRIDEAIVIDGNITVMVVDIVGDKVKLGIDAPKEICVDRQEVYEAKLSERASASQAASQSAAKPVSQ